MNKEKTDKGKTDNSLSINHEYKAWLKDLKQQFLKTQLQAAVSVNSTLLEFYWGLGAEIIEKQKQSKWGEGFISQLSQDLMAEFPEIKGFSKRNLEQIRKWYRFWSAGLIKTKQPVSQLWQIPWGHNFATTWNVGARSVISAQAGN